MSAKNPPSCRMQDGGFLTWLFLVLPGGDGLILVFFLENLPAEKENGVNCPQEEENTESDEGVAEGASCKIQEEKQGSNHHHGRGNLADSDSDGIKPRFLRHRQQFADNCTEFRGYKVGKLL